MSWRIFFFDLLDCVVLCFYGCLLQWSFIGLAFGCTRWLGLSVWTKILSRLMSSYLNWLFVLVCLSDCCCCFFWKDQKKSWLVRKFCSRLTDCLDVIGWLIYIRRLDCNGWLSSYLISWLADWSMDHWMYGWIDMRN